MYCRIAVIALALGLLVPQPIMGQTEASTADWGDARFAARFEAFDWLIGEWQGYGQFADRTGYIHKRYSYDVAGMYFVERTLDMFPPPQPSTEFEVHQDFTLRFELAGPGEEYSEIEVSRFRRIR